MGDAEMTANRRLLALTTGQAARCCFVTSDTIVNWIKAGLIRAQRTAGGQYRILLSDLRVFMCSRGMSTELLDDGPGDWPMCWEFHLGTDAGNLDRSACDGCLVKSLGVLNCFKLMGLRPGKGHLHKNCEECDYFRRWGDTLKEDKPIQRIRGGK